MESPAELPANIMSSNTPTILATLPENIMTLNTPTTLATLPENIMTSSTPTVVAALPVNVTTPNSSTAVATQSGSHFLPNATGFEIVGGQFVLGDVHNHVVNAPPDPRSSISLPSNTLEEAFSESEVYCSHMLRRRRGFPLYEPAPQINLPAEYQRHGVSIGDVGSVTPEGIFDFFFNIFLPPEHPINANDTPEDFSPMSPYKAKDVVHLKYGPGAIVSSRSVRKLDFDAPSNEFPGGEFTFRCNKLRNVENMRTYAAEHADSWYRYINGERGRGLTNGDLYLVTGCEKARSWGMASYHAVCEEFELTFKPPYRMPRPYRWSGAHACQNPAETKVCDPPSTNAPVNQTTFIHGFSISLPTGLWGKLFGTVQTSSIVDFQCRLNTTGGSCTGSSYGSLFSLSWIGGSGATGGTRHAGDHGEVVLSDLSPVGKVFDPAKLINAYILHKASQATVVMSHDDDWSDILGDDSEIASPSDLLRRIDDQFTINEKEGATFLVPKSTPSGRSSARTCQDGPLRPVIQTTTMAYISPTSSSGRQSPTPSSVSSNVSPRFNKRSSHAHDPRPRNSNRVAEYNASAIKGGCWTCRLRRKKCDENREGNSCHTCIRLTIQCLGWGPKRPEWMRDKQAVEAYKADIKAQLTRGQPRSSLLSPMPNASSRLHDSSIRRPYPQHRRSADSSTSSLLNRDVGVDYSDQYAPRHSMFPAMPGASNSAFYSDPSVASSVEFNSGIFGTQKFNLPVTSNPGSTQIPPLDFDFAQLGSDGFDLAVRAPSPEQAVSLFAGHSSLQENHCIYYFERVRKVQYIFAGNTVANVTCSMILQAPRGAVTNSVCALASLHYTRMRTAQGLEAPEENSEYTTAKYFYDEAYFQLHNAKQLRGPYSESDAIAALHLVWFSQLSGGATDWQPVFAFACGWVAQQTDLLTNDNPKLALQSLPVAGQLIVKLTLWLDIFSSLTVMRLPKYLALYKRLFGDLAGRNLHNGEIRMDSLTGCSEEVLLGIAEVSELSHWKAAEKRRGSLSIHDLIRRGDEIEQRLRKAPSSPRQTGEIDTTPLHPALVQADSEAVDAAPFPSNETRQLVAKIFSESVLLYLYTVLSNSNPDVPEISNSVGVVVQLLGQLPPSDVDRALVFPISLAGCMTDNSNWRDFLKGRLLALDESVGNIMRTRLVMEAVWQKRDISGATVDWRETMCERGLNLLLV
ncbi:Zn(2)-C6 fungal-type domain-containing protein [Mycena venus]|uniref:Zn(2)-C6 fungal-type domain-containing protein n=1 Tax=Mycena venus TaxID=2733690 RepID=A0A8H6YCF6_9AGAR|nr:Zn(2)-C6 fungal-type domain-containing protein [Mycena venus]